MTLKWRIPDPILALVLLSKFKVRFHGTVTFWRHWHFYESLRSCIEFRNILRLFQYVKFTGYSLVEIRCGLSFTRFLHFQAFQDSYGIQFLVFLPYLQLFIRLEKLWLYYGILQYYISDYVTSSEVCYNMLITLRYQIVHFFLSTSYPKKCRFCSVFCSW